MKAHFYYLKTFKDLYSSLMYETIIISNSYDTLLYVGSEILFSYGQIFFIMAVIFGHT